MCYCMCAIHGNAFYHGALRAGHRTVNFVSETDDWFMMCISHATELCKHHCAPLKPGVKFVEEIIGHGWKKLKWTCMKYIEIHVWSTLGWQQLSFGDYIRHRFGSLTAENSLCSIKGPSCGAKSSLWGGISLPFRSYPRSICWSSIRSSPSFWSRKNVLSHSPLHVVVRGVLAICLHRNGKHGVQKTLPASLKLAFVSRAFVC